MKTADKLWLWLFWIPAAWVWFGLNLWALMGHGVKC